MKTAISIDNTLFSEAEFTAHKLGISRSKLFSLAIEEFVEQYKSKSITEKLNDYYSKNSNKLHKDLEKAQLLIFHN